MFNNLFRVITIPERVFLCLETPGNNAFLSLNNHGVSLVTTDFGKYFQIFFIVYIN